MNVSYFGPVQRSWDRARRMLFSPFRLESWLTIGFAAFLSEWFTGGFGGSGNVGGRQRFGGLDARDSGEALRMMVDRVRDFVQNPFWMGIILWVIAAVVAVAILFQWIGSRGKLVLLDTAVRERATIRDSWSRLGHLGDSLFLCRLLMGLVAIGLMAGVGFVTVGAGLRELLLGREDPFAILAPMIGGFLLLGCLGMLVSFVFLLLDSFVVPIMYRHHIGAGAAWGRFLPLFGAHFISFVAYAVMVLVLSIAKAMLVVVGGFMTCCIGFMLLIVPYVGQVVLLPVHVFFRGLGPDFLAQFGPDFDVYGMAPAAPVASAPLAPPPAPGPTA